MGKLEFIILLTAISLIPLKASSKPPKIKMKYNGVSIIAAGLGIETMDNIWYPYDVQALKTSFSVINSSKFKPFIGASTSITNMYMPSDQKIVPLFKIGLSTGTSFQIGNKTYGSAGIGLATADFTSAVYSGSLSLSKPVGKIGKNFDMRFFGSLYAKKVINKTPFIPGVLIGLNIKHNKKR